MAEYLNNFAPPQAACRQTTGSRRADYDGAKRACRTRRADCGLPIGGARMISDREGFAAR